MNDDAVLYITENLQWGIRSPVASLNDSVRIEEVQRRSSRSAWLQLCPVSALSALYFRFTVADNQEAERQWASGCSPDESDSVGRFVRSRETREENSSFDSPDTTKGQSSKKHITSEKI